jgi:hypothetical protein
MHIRDPPRPEGDEEIPVTRPMLVPRVKVNGGSASVIGITARVGLIAVQAKKRG